MGDNAFLGASDKHHRELQPLRCVDGHDIHLAGIFLILVIAAQQRDAIEVGIQRRVKVVRVCLPRVDGLQEAFDIQKLKARRFFVFLKFLRQIIKILNALYELSYLACQALSGQQLFPLGVDQLNKFLQIGKAFFSEVVRRALKQRMNRHADRALLFRCDCGEHFQRFFSDTAPRCVDNPQEVNIVVGIRNHPQIADNVFNFFALKKARAAGHPVRNIGIEEGFFNRAPQAVGTDQNAEVRIAPVLAHLLCKDSVRNKISLCRLILRDKNFNRLAGAVPRPQRFFLPVGIVRNHPVGSR